MQPVLRVQYIPRNMHTVFALLCFVVVIHWLIFPYPSGLLHWHCGNLTIAPVPAKQPWWIWINTSSEFIMNDCITTTKQNTTKPCAYFLGNTVYPNSPMWKFTLPLPGVTQDSHFNISKYVRVPLRNLKNGILPATNYWKMGPIWKIELLSQCWPVSTIQIWDTGTQQLWENGMLDWKRE